MKEDNLLLAYIKVFEPYTLLPIKNIVMPINFDRTTKSHR